MRDDSYQMRQTSKRLISLREPGQVLIEWLRKLLPIGREFKYPQRDDPRLQADTAEAANSDAKFLGWQKTKSGEVYALYTVTAEHHPLYQSTVSERTLRRQGLQIPPTPPPNAPIMRFDHEQ
jgi:hypothetical protein